MMINRISLLFLLLIFSMERCLVYGAGDKEQLDLPKIVAYSSSQPNRSLICYLGSENAYANHTIQQFGYDLNRRITQKLHSLNVHQKPVIYYTSAQAPIRVMINRFLFNYNYQANTFTTLDGQTLWEDTLPFFIRKKKSIS